MDLSKYIPDFGFGAGSGTGSGGIPSAITGATSQPISFFGTSSQRKGRDNGSSTQSMFSGFGGPGGMFSAMAGAASVRGSGASTSKWITTAMTIFFLIALLTAAGYFISLFVKIPGVGGGVTLPPTSGPIWTKGEIASVAANSNLQADMSGFLMTTDSTQFTVSMELQIQAPFANTGALRHIFHRGGAIVDATGADIANARIQTPLNLTVPSGGIALNPAVFLLNNTTNTIWVVIQNTNNELAAVATIANVPVFKPFRLTIAISAHVMDVYLDCKLSQSAYITGTISPTVPTKIYGHLSTDFPGIVGGVRLYRTALSAQQVQMLCNMSPVLTLFQGNYNGGCSANVASAATAAETSATQTLFGS